MNNESREMVEDKVYKYRCWSNYTHRRILTENEIYLSSPDRFNDPFDCRITPDYSMLNNEEKIDLFVSSTVASAHKSNPSLNIEEEKKELKSRLVNDFNGTMKVFKDIYHANQSSMYGIFSLSYLWNSILMWSHYSENHAGFTVGFDLASLKKIPEFAMGGPVMYCDDFPSINPLDTDILANAFKEINSKARQWDYEGEYRLFNLIGPRIKDRVVRLPNSCFREVILGLNFPDKDISEIASLISDREIELYRIVNVPREFRIDKIRIS